MGWILKGRRQMLDSSCPLALAVISTSVSKDSRGKLGAGGNPGPHFHKPPCSTSEFKDIIWGLQQQNNSLPLTRHRTEDQKATCVFSGQRTIGWLTGKILTGKLELLHRVTVHSEVLCYPSNRWILLQLRSFPNLSQIWLYDSSNRLMWCHGDVLALRA